MDLKLDDGHSANLEPHNEPDARISKEEMIQARDVLCHGY